MSGVLVVEDEHVLANVLAEILRDEGQQVWTAYDGAQALELAHAHRPAVVLLDLMLPRMDGRRVLQALRQDDALRDTRVVAISSAPFPPDTREHVSAFLPKPFSLEQLLTTLARVRG